MDELSKARVLAGALMSSPILLWVAGWVLTEGGTRPMLEPGSLSPSLAFVIWAAVALPAFAAALALRSRAEALAKRPGRALTYLLVAWALLEGSALLSGVFFVLLAIPRFIWTGALVFLLGMAFTFPRADWFPGATTGR
ncbi:MAG: hypothetical protein WEA09_13665 [Gemmatimonadota bacterium]